VKRIESRRDRGDLLEVSTELLRRYGLVAEDIRQFLYQSGFRVFYCRERDLAGKPTARVTFSCYGLNRLHLARSDLFPPT
jgi:hypothetical protein